MRVIPTEFTATATAAPSASATPQRVRCPERGAEHGGESGERGCERGDSRGGGPGSVQHCLDQADEGREGEEEQGGEPDRDEFDRADVSVKPHRHHQPEPRAAPPIRARQAELSPRRPAVDEQPDDEHERAHRGDSQSVGAAFVGIARDRHRETEANRREQRQSRPAGLSRLDIHDGPLGRGLLVRGIGVRASRRRSPGAAAPRRRGPGTSVFDARTRTGARSGDRVPPPAGSRV